MTLIINHTTKSGWEPETIANVKNYIQKTLWTIEVTYNDNTIENFYAVENVKEFV